MKHVNRPFSTLFLKFLSGTLGLFEELGRHAKWGGSQECPTCGACKEFVEHVLFECASYDSQRQIFFGILVHVHEANSYSKGLQKFSSQQHIYMYMYKAVFCLHDKYM